MKLYIGADHRGFDVKEMLKTWLETDGHEVVDCGNFKKDPEDDFPDFTFPVAESVTEEEGAFGIVVCGSGGGVTIAANKVPGIRCVLGMNVEDVTHNRAHDDANVLALAANFTPEDTIKNMVTAFVTTPFSGEDKYKRRLNKIIAYEQACCGDDCSCEEEGTEGPQHGHCDCC